ncbi:hypothetical protein EHQ82_05610 [Leptospira selangorensis]|uniref:Uncharacterized protein n=2 Tax=Leptospira selangorensis TaxID=2484982 RepID=A0ABY2NFI6_9LEPT|nr:hypothetical protein EHQ82_05610 [Leptospira selangorensis]
MFACKNSIIELVYFENSIQNQQLTNLNFWISGFALRSSNSIDSIRMDLQRTNLQMSDITIQNVKDKEGKSVPISKILLINNSLPNLQVFFIEYLNNFLLKKYESISKESDWKISNFQINSILTKEKDKQLIQLGFNSSDNLVYSDKKGINFSFMKSDSNFPIINSFNIESINETIDLVKFFEN